MLESPITVTAGAPRAAAQNIPVNGRGMTARYLLRQTYRVQPGDWILIHAAAGGAQWVPAHGSFSCTLMDSGGDTAPLSIAF